MHFRLNITTKKKQKCLFCSAYIFSSKINKKYIGYAYILNSKNCKNCFDKYYENLSFLNTRKISIKYKIFQKHDKRRSFEFSECNCRNQYGIPI